MLSLRMVVFTLTAVGCVCAMGYGAKSYADHQAEGYGDSDAFKKSFRSDFRSSKGSRRLDRHGTYGGTRGSVHNGAFFIGSDSGFFKTFGGGFGGAHADAFNGDTFGSFVKSHQAGKIANGARQRDGFSAAYIGHAGGGYASGGSHALGSSHNDNYKVGLDNFDSYNFNIH